MGYARLTLDRAVPVNRTLAPGAWLTVEGAFTFDAEGRTKEDILAWEPFVTGFRVASEQVLPMPGQGEEPLVERAFGFVTGFSREGETLLLGLDEAQWLTGKAAAQGMLADGHCPEGVPCEPPNPFYIRNPDPAIRMVAVSPDVEIILQTYSHTALGTFQHDEAVSLDVFQALFAPGADSHLPRVPYHLEIRDGLVVRIEEQYVP